MLKGGSPTPSPQSIWVWWHTNGIHGNTIQHWRRIQEFVTSDFTHVDHAHFCDVTWVFPQHNLQAPVQSVLTVTSSSHASVHWTDASGRCTVTQSCDDVDQNNGVYGITASVKSMYCWYLCACEYLLAVSDSQESSYRCVCLKGSEHC